MSDDERVLRSFVGEDEAWQGHWTVTAVKRSAGQLPPGAAGEETVAVTDDRLLWFQNELETVAIDRIENVELEYVEQQAAPPIVLGGGLLFVVGVFASIGAFFANAGGPMIVALPALTGLMVFLATRIVADHTGREGEVRAGHRLRLWVDGDPVSVWGQEEATIEEVAAAIDGAVEVGETDDSVVGAEESIDDAVEAADTHDDSPDDPPTA